MTSSSLLLPARALSQIRGNYSEAGCAHVYLFVSYQKFSISSGEQLQEDGAGLCRVNEYLDLLETWHPMLLTEFSPIDQRDFFNIMHHCTETTCFILSEITSEIRRRDSLLLLESTGTRNIKDFSWQVLDAVSYICMLRLALMRGRTRAAIAAHLQLFNRVWSIGDLHWIDTVISERTRDNLCTAISTGLGTFCFLE